MPAEIRCKATNRQGGQCRRNAIIGGVVCRYHGGSSPAVARKALVRAEIMDWGLNDEKIDPGEMLLRLVAQSARRAALYAGLLEADYADKKTAALIGAVYNEEGTKTGEYMRGLALLEAQERDRCANFAGKAVAAGLAEREIRIAEREGSQIVAVLRAALTALGLDPDAPQVRVIVAEQLRAIA